MPSASAPNATESPLVGGGLLHELFPRFIVPRQIAIRGVLGFWGYGVRGKMPNFIFANIVPRSKPRHFKRHRGLPDALLRPWPPPPHHELGLAAERQLSAFSIAGAENVRKLKLLAKADVCIVKVSLGTLRATLRVLVVQVASIRLARRV